MKFCSQCGCQLELRVPEGDNRQRHVCSSCGAIHYQNPKVVTGCIPEWQGRVLLCRRAIAPRYGLWTLPAGFLENGETMSEGAAREALEEANAKLEVGELFAIYSVPHINQVYAFFRSRLLDPEVWPGEESLEVVLANESEIPWDDIAFPAVHKTLELYFEDRRSGRFRTHSGEA